MSGPPKWRPILQPKEFRSFLSRIYNAYGRKTPDDEVVEHLTRTVGHVIPLVGADWIVERFKTVNDKFPAIVERAIMACWHDWRREHSEQAAPDLERHDCRNPNCDRGWLHLERYEPMYGENHRFVAVCGDCGFIVRARAEHVMTMRRASQLGFLPAKL